MSNKSTKKQATRASNASKATQESQPTDSDTGTCEDTGSQSASEFIEFVRRSLNSLNSKFDAFVERQEKLEIRVTAVEVRVTSQEKAVEGVVESVDFTAEKVNNVWHSLETLQKSLAEATREIADSHIAMTKLSETASRQERHSRAFNIRVLGVHEENGENCKHLLERVISSVVVAVIRGHTRMLSANFGRSQSIRRMLSAFTIKKKVYFVCH